MNIRTWTHWLVLLALLVGGLSQTRPAQALTGTDKVIWCPATVIPPTPKKNGCTDAVLSLDALQIALVLKKPAVAGAIWIGKDYNSTPDGDQFWSGFELTKMAKYPLTIQGGWNGGAGLDLTKPSILDGVSFTIENWQGNLTLRNLVVQQVDNLDCPNFALCVSTKGSIKLDRVQMFNNIDGGAYLNNTASASSPPASMTITNSQFNGNGGNGLDVRSKGKITLTNVWAEANTGDGVYVNNNPGSVFLNGTNTFLSNAEDGLSVFTSGGVTANHLIAFANSQQGVFISADKAVTITGSGIFKGNDSSGLEIATSGPITAKNLTATYNGNRGLYLWTNAPVDTQAVNLSNVNADSNVQSGIEIYADGKITLSCSSSYKNGTTGLFVRGATDTAGPAAALKLQNFQSHLNGTANGDILATTLVQSTVCP